MSVTGLVDAGRAAHERLMVDQCTINRVTAGVMSPVTGALAETFTAVYAGKCRMKTAVVKTVDAGERANILTQPVLALPADTMATILKGDAVTVLDALGRTAVFRVLGEQNFGSTSSARLFTVEAAEHG